MPRRKSPFFPSDSKRKPTREELLIWDYVTQGDTRLPEAHIDWQAVEAELRPAPKPAAATPPPQRPSDDQLDSLIRKTGFTRAGEAHAPEKREGGLDRNSARRLRQGKFAIEATLDLHGMGQEEARHHLHYFLRRAYESQKRCVLVVTGKGRFRAADDSRETGILRRALPRWLSQPPLADWVLRHEPARPQHGGEGAVYILLRRRR